MKYLLHGDDTAASRRYLLELTEGYQTTTLDGKSLILKDFEEKTRTSDLFEEKRAIIVENLLSKNAKKKDFIVLVNNQKENILLVFWEDKKLTKIQSNSLKNTTVKEFVLPQNFFQFLDSFAPGNAKSVYSLYQKVIASQAAELIFYSLLKRLRLLLMIVSNSRSSEFSKMAPWQLSKLQQQARLWPEEKLSKFYKEFTELEIKMKSGKLPLELSKHIDILILTKLT